MGLIRTFSQPSRMQRMQAEQANLNPNAFFKSELIPDGNRVTHGLHTPAEMQFLSALGKVVTSLPYSPSVKVSPHPNIIQEIYWERGIRRVAASARVEKGSSMALGYQHGLRWLTRPWASIQPSAVTEAMDINTDPGYYRATDPDMVFGSSL